MMEPPGCPGALIFVRLSHPKTHLEAMTSRPLLLEVRAKEAHRAGQRRLTITSFSLMLNEI